MKNKELINKLRNTVERAHLTLIEDVNQKKDQLDAMSSTVWGSPRGQQLQRVTDNLENAEMLLGDAIAFLARAEEMMERDSS